MDDVARQLNMTAVGVGVSQVLPVLVMGLAADPGTVLLFEQPELHLHPAVQQRLGDFLLACSRSGRQVVVETHSDHLVTRLRRRIAEDADDRLVNQVAIFSADRTDGRSEFNLLKTNRYGGFDQWPDGFFDDGPRDAQHLVQAALRKQSPS
jgi:predicted ATPase